VNGFSAPNAVYLVLLLVFVGSSLLAMRLPLARAAKMALAWVAIFAAGFVLFSFRDNLGWFAQRLKAEAVGTPIEEGSEIRIPMAADGHFWVVAKINGHDVNFLVDSGATTTTVDRRTAERTGIEVGSRRDQYVRTANGIVRMASGRAGQITVGGIARQDLAVQVADREDLNVLGMNFLSTLSRWSVEGRWLVLVP